ncbi:MAG TPA: nucleotidyltransferase domain-containing protein [Actinomycetota bacterium]|nr:nucleotidyltransferase domain-containing protein [Actinomycetota bacterium]
MTPARLDERVQRLLGRLAEGLRRLYGDRLRGVYVFGSYARGAADPESDLDVLVVLEDLARYGDEVDRTSELVGEVSLEYGIAVSRVFVREREWREAASAFLANVRDEAVRV